MVADPTGLVELLRLQTTAVLARDPAVLGDLVTRCVRIKADVVARDPEERTGLRATLNLGHTFAHALETAGGYGLTHGEAVAIGLVFAGALAGGCERVGPDVVDRYQAVPATLGLMTEVPGGEGLDPDELLALMRRDKKASGGLTFVLPGPGRHRAGRRSARARAAVRVPVRRNWSVGTRWPRSSCSRDRT